MPKTANFKAFIQEKPHINAFVLTLKTVERAQAIFVSGE